MKKVEINNVHMVTNEINIHSKQSSSGCFFGSIVIPWFQGFKKKCWMGIKNWFGYHLDISL